MHFNHLPIGLMILLIITSCGYRPLKASAIFKGTWKLDKYESFDSTAGRWIDSRNRIGYSGYIIYDGMGHMAVQLIPPGFDGFDNSKNIDSLSNEEVRRVLRLQFASFSYFASYTLSKTDHSIEHDRISSNNPKEWGSKAHRDFAFKSDTLILTANELIGGSKTRLRWVRL